MTIRQVQAQGFNERHEVGDAAKLAWLNADSARRFMELAWVAEARRLNLRAAHRRWMRRNGYSFNGMRRTA